MSNGSIINNENFSNLFNKFIRMTIKSDFQRSSKLINQSSIDNYYHICKDDHYQQENYSDQVKILF